jgi:hypothetical protein
MKRILISLLGLTAIFLYSTTTVKAAEHNRPPYAYFEGYGLGKFDENDTFIPSEAMTDEDFVGLPYLMNRNHLELYSHMSNNYESIPVVEYDQTLKQTGYWTSWKNHKKISKEYFIKVDYPKNKDKVSKFIYGPFVYDGKLLYISDRSGNFIGEQIQLPSWDKNLSDYPVLNEEEVILAQGVREYLYWYLDAEGKRVELGIAPVWLNRAEDPPLPGGIPVVDDISDTKATIVLTLDDKIIPIPDITDPTLPLSPNTPNEVDHQALASALTLTQYPKAFNFGSLKVSAKDNEAVFLAKQELNAKSGEKEGVQVYDGRLIEQGYSVTAEFTGFESKGKATLKGASIVLADKDTHLSLTDTNKFSAQQKGFSLSKETAATTVLDTDDAKFFTGNYWSETDVQLVIPKGAIEIGTHEGVVTWTLQSKPSV